MADDIYTYPLLGWVRTVVLGITAFIVASYVTYEVALVIDPPFYEGHPHMVLGQAVLGFFGGCVMMPAAMILDRRHQRRKRLAVIASYTEPARARALDRR